MTSSSKKHRVRHTVQLPAWALITVVLLGAFAFVGSSVWIYRTTRAMASTLEISSPDFGVVAEPIPGMPVTVADSPDETAVEPPPLLSADALKPWSGQERISILLLGIDQRCEDEGPSHTDSMMALTVDPVELTAAVLSLPRDLWVEIPGLGSDRINQAYYFGELYEYPGGGPTLAMETAAATLGVPIDYYATVNFDAFIEAVDIIGGITVNVPEAINDPDYPDKCNGYDPFSIAAGEHRLDGEIALKYARTRATFGGDVDRAGRQQAVILAVRDQIMQLGMLPQLIAQSPRLWQALQDNVRTNLSLDEGLQLALLMQDIPRENIQTAVIDYNYVYNEITPDERQVLALNRDEIRKLRSFLFAPSPIPPAVIENLPALMTTEKAQVALHNGTAVFGLAAATQEYLQQYDINVAEIGNADSAAFRASQIIDYGFHPNTTAYLAQLMHVPPLNIRDDRPPAGDYDVLVIIGDDWRVPEP
ncbi:MAG: LCP family protein [Chloroflexi bacterium]|nr:LCP family protein [Chloroflexota bacterium]